MRKEIRLVTMDIISFHDIAQMERDGFDVEMDGKIVMIKKGFDKGQGDKQ